MGQNLQIVLWFALGLALALVFALIFRKSGKGVLAFAINSVAAAILLIVLSLTKVIVVAVNPFNVFFIGALGVPGLAAIIAATFLIV